MIVNDKGSNETRWWWIRHAAFGKAGSVAHLRPVGRRLRRLVGGSVFFAASANELPRDAVWLTSNPAAPHAADGGGDSRRDDLAAGSWWRSRIRRAASGRLRAGARRFRGPRPRALSVLVRARRRAGAGAKARRCVQARVAPDNRAAERRINGAGREHHRRRAWRQHPRGASATRGSGSDPMPRSPSSSTIARSGRIDRTRRAVSHAS